MRHEINLGLNCVSVCVSCVYNNRLLSSTSLRPLFLLSVFLLGLILLDRWKHKLPLIHGKSSDNGP